MAFQLLRFNTGHVSLEFGESDLRRSNRPLRKSRLPPIVRFTTYAELNIDGETFTVDGDTKEMASYRGAIMG